MTATTSTPATTAHTASTAAQSSGPWWKFGHVWMVFGGPAIAVAASFYTLYLAVTRPDPVTDVNYYQNGLNINKDLSTTTDSFSPSANATSLAPAELARNNAATGVPMPKQNP